MEVLEEKLLSDGARLQLMKHQLDENTAKYLCKPVGYCEIHISLKKDRGLVNTSVRKSIYLTEQNFRDLYGAISDTNEFDVVNKFLEVHINRHKDREEVPKFLKVLYAKKPN